MTAVDVYVFIERREMFASFQTSYISSPQFLLA